MKMQMEIKLVVPQDGREDKGTFRQDRICMSMDKNFTLLSVTQDL